MLSNMFKFSELSVHMYQRTREETAVAPDVKSNFNSASSR